MLGDILYIHTFFHKKESEFLRLSKANFLNDFSEERSVFP